MVGLCFVAADPALFGRLGALHVANRTTAVLPTAVRYGQKSSQSCPPSAHILFSELAVQQGSSRHQFSIGVTDV